MKLLRLMMYGGAGAAGVAAYNCDSTACRIAKEALRERAAEALELAPSSAGEAASNLEAWMKAMQDHLEQIVTRQDNAHAQSLALMQAQTAALTGMANSRSSRVSVIGATGAALVGVYFFARWRGWSLMGLLPATRKALSRMAKQLDEARCALEAAVATLKQDITERQEQAQRGIEDIQERTESMQGQMRALEDGQGDVSEKLDRLRRAQVLGLQMTYTMGQALYEALCRVGTSPSPAVRELGGLTKQVGSLLNREHGPEDARTHSQPAQLDGGGDDHGRRRHGEPAALAEVRQCHRTAAVAPVGLQSALRPRSAGAALLHEPRSSWGAGKSSEQENSHVRGTQAQTGPGDRRADARPRRQIAFGSLSSHSPAGVDDSPTQPLRPADANSARTTGARGQKAPSSSAPFDDLDDLFSRGRALDASVFDSKW